MTIGEEIRQFRKDNLLTLREAATLFDTSPSEISRLESGKNKIHFINEAKWKKKLAEAKSKKGGI